MLDVFRLILHKWIMGNVGFGFAGNVLHGYEGVPHCLLQIEIHFDFDTNNKLKYLEISIQPYKK